MSPANLGDSVINADDLLGDGSYFAAQLVFEKNTLLSRRDAALAAADTVEIARLLAGTAFGGATPEQLRHAVHQACVDSPGIDAKLRARSAAWLAANG